MGWVVWWWTVAWLGVAVEGALRVESPSHLARELTVYTNNVHIGPRQVPVAIQRARASVYSGGPRPSIASLNCSMFAGTVVLLTSVESSWNSRDELDTALALEACGAVCVVRSKDTSVGARSYLGLTYYYNDFECCREQGGELGVSLLVGWGDDLEPLREAIEDRGDAVVVSIAAADRNPWVHDVYHHLAFVIVARGVLTFLNALLLLFGFRALALHLPCCARGHRSRHRSVLDSMRWFIVGALVMLVIGAGVRIAYCAVCPFFSNANFPNLVTHLTINVSMPLQLPAVVVASAIFHKVISVHKTVSAPTGGWAAAGVLVCVLMLGLELFAGYMRGMNKSFELVFLLSTVLVPLTVLVASVVFLSRGIPFLRRMKSMRTLRRQSSKGKDPLRHIRVRFTRSIVNASFGMLLQLLVLVVGAASPSVFLSTTGFPTLWLLYYVGLTIAAFNFVAAFAPGVHVPLPVPDAVRRRLSRGLRRAMPLAFFGADVPDTSASYLAADNSLQTFQTDNGAPSNATPSRAAL